MEAFNSSGRSFLTSTPLHSASTSREPLFVADVDGGAEPESSLRWRFVEGFNKIQSVLRELSEDRLDSRQGHAEALAVCSDFVRHTAEHKYDSLETSLVAEEHHTWRLLETYFKFELERLAGEQLEVDTPGVDPESDHAMLDQFRLHEPIFAWMTRVLQWAEGTANRPDDKEAQAACCQQAVGPNEYTLREIQATATEEFSAYVHNLDPDASSRLGKSPHPRDAGQEDNFLRFVWSYLRAGDLKGCQNLCRRNRQNWRAATLEGCVVGRGGTQRNFEFRQPWREACRQLAGDPNCPKYERAVYGLLTADGEQGLRLFGRDAASAIPGVMQTWYDKLYVWAKLTVDERQDQLLASAAGNGGEEDMGQGAFDQQKLLASWKRFKADAKEGGVQTVQDNVPSKSAAASMLQFFQQTQEQIIFLQARLVASLPSDLGLPPARFHGNANALKSQGRRCALHMQVLVDLFSGGPQDASSSEHIQQYIALLVKFDDLDRATAETETIDGADDVVLSEHRRRCLRLIAIYSQGLQEQQKEQALADALQCMPTDARQVIVEAMLESEEEAVQAQLVMDRVQRSVVARVANRGTGSATVPGNDSSAAISMEATHQEASLFISRQDLSAKLDVFRWAIAQAHHDSSAANNPVGRVHGLRHLNAFLRKTLLESLEMEIANCSESDMKESAVDDHDDLFAGKTRPILRGVGRDDVEGYKNGLLDDELLQHIDQLVAGLLGPEWTDCWEAESGRFRAIDGVSEPEPIDEQHDPRSYTRVDCRNDAREFQCWDLFDRSQAAVAELVEVNAYITKYQHQTSGIHDIRRRQQEAYGRAIRALAAVICFPGWMQDLNGRLGEYQGPQSETEAGRLGELAKLRKICLPRICFQLLHHMQENGDFNQCLNLIEQIAVEDNPVYTAFNERDMCRLLSIIPSILLHVADTPPELIDEDDRERQEGLIDIFNDLTTD